MTRCQGSDCKYFEKFVLMVGDMEIQDPFEDIMPEGTCELIEGIFLNPRAYKGHCDLYEKGE